jgi:hypothetical protein
MSATSQNLIEIQSLLQDPVRVSMQDLMKYANGSNPEVPSFLALMELSRRSQVERTTQDFNKPQGTVKDQTIAALMGRQPPQQVNPTLPAQGASLGSAPPMVNPTQAPQQVNPTQAPQQVNPAANPVQAASGGLMSIPVNNMFKAKNYAAGGIVAFDEGGSTNDEFRKSERNYRRAEEMAANPYPRRATYSLRGQPVLGPRSMDEIMAGLPAVTRTAGARPDDMTIEEAAARQKEIQRVAGVSQDPYAEAREFQRGIEARQAEERKGDALDRLLAQATAFAAADPTKGFGYQAAASSSAARLKEGEQRAIREKQDTVSRDFRVNQAKEEDARRRNDATGIAAALLQQKKDQAEYDKLQMEYDRLDQQRYTTAGNIRNADINEAKIPVDVFQAETTRMTGESDADYKKRMAAASEKNAATAAAREKREEESKPTADDIIRNNILGRVNADPIIRQLAKSMEGMDPSSPEYQQSEMAIYNRMKTYFAGYERLLPPAPRPVSPLPERPRTGFFGGTIGGRPAPTPNAVPFEALPPR